MSSEEEGPVAWLRAEIEGDGRKAAKRLRRASSDDFRRLTMERLARAKAELAILDLHDQTRAIAKPAEPPRGELRARDCLDAQRELCALEGVVRLLASGYKHRPGYPAVFAAG